MVTSGAGLEALCRQMAAAATIAFDTEFVSEDTYRPELCLVQVAVERDLYLIDPLEIDDLRPFWDALAAPGHKTLVHAGRQELLFCLDSVGRPPHELFDVQLAAGMVGMEYPAGYGNLLTRLLNVQPNKGETRTDWRRRPLSERQIQYALDDVFHLQPLYDTLVARLDRLKRRDWFHEEMSAWQADIDASRGNERWRRVTGSSNLSPRSLAIVRELWQWREGEASRRDIPTRQILRDDLIVELAKRRSADAKQIAAVRGMERGDLRRVIPDLANVVAKGLAVPEKECPVVVRNDSSSQLTMLGQFLSSALSSICRDAEVATSLVGTASDVRDLVAFRLGQWSDPEKPALMRGWRSQVVGQLLDDLLAGNTSIRIANLRSDQPLAFEPRQKQ
ncbi:MAG: HRDC domain-containing protein [Planctomycetes bacterium]|nr:HRDC domain-containing protein [Planctomycetota bacterium]